MRGGLLGGAADLGRIRRVEVPSAREHEPDIDRLPDAERKRVAAVFELQSGLLDRECR
jgi:hypothetical protein